ncbi:terminase [Clostridium sp. OS1-26]|uniref:XkdQ/YqbQ family protein n=1 Tax=Clostridium sp. OS1-26 TaxID=3070681 RepID=UPI0027E0B294|nr:terminase [Clostridium sp. OS1-26]WML35945.1 terminase [Clostridium sp. OS1-26]
MYLSVWALYDRKILENITDFCKTVQISGDVQQCARKLDINMAYSIRDKNQPNAQIGPGTIIYVSLDFKEIYRGVVVDREINSGAQEITFTAYDYLMYFLRSKVTYNFQNIESEYAVEKICKDLGGMYNYIPTTGIKINRLIQNKTAYEAIMEIYTQVNKVNNIKYMPYADYDMFSVMEKGEVITNQEWHSYTGTVDVNAVLSPDLNMAGTVYKDTSSNMVNKVKIYDENGNAIGATELEDVIKFYGVFQEEYQKEENKDPVTEARKLLHGIDREFSVTAIGDWRCRTGYAMQVKIPYIDILADTIMFIDGDTHTWELASGKYTMDLKLSYYNTMDAKEE